MKIPDSEKCSGEADRPRIILAVSDAKRKEAYLSALSSSAELTLTESLREIPRLLRQAPCNGILMDVSLKVKASHMDKVRIADSLEAMPSATLNMDGRGSIRILMLNQRHGSARTVEEFTALCAAFHPATVYPDDLRSLRLNAIISTSPEFGRDAEKTITMFISGSGCFLFTATPERYHPQSGVWIDFVGISERKPVLGKVLWQCPWGVSHKVSGIYVGFESILESQHAEITALLANGKDNAGF
jgi:Tfp pilus assembly protein PilZ